MLPFRGKVDVDGNEGAPRILQSSNITGTSPSDCLVTYPGHSLVVGSYPSAEKQSEYFTAQADWVIRMDIYVYKTGSHL